MSEAETANFEFGERFLAVLDARDWTALEALLTEDISWTFPGEVGISGTVVGRDSVIERYKTIFSHRIHAERLNLLANKNGVALSFHNTAQEDDGRTLDEYLVNVLFVTEGKIERMESFVSDPDGLISYFENAPSNGSS